MMQSELNRVGEYLLVVEEAHASKTAVERLAAERHLNPTLAANWASLTGLSDSTAPTAKGHYTSRLSDVGGHASVHGWGFEQTPSLLVNHSDEALTITTLTVPGRSVVVHPSPQDEAIVYSRGPIDSEVRVEGLVADADAQCGNGVAWRVELINNAGTVGVAAGTIDNGSRQTVKASKPLKVTTGDLISLVVNARDRQHACDTAHRVENHGSRQASTRLGPGRGHRESRARKQSTGGSIRQRRHMALLCDT